MCFRLLQSDIHKDMYTVMPQTELQETQKLLGTVRGQKVDAEQQKQTADEQIKVMEVL